MRPGGVEAPSVGAAAPADPPLATYGLLEASWGDWSSTWSCETWRIAPARDLELADDEAAQLEADLAAAGQVHHPSLHPTHPYHRDRRPGQAVPALAGWSSLRSVLAHLPRPGAHAAAARDRVWLALVIAHDLLSASNHLEGQVHGPTAHGLIEPDAIWLHPDGRMVLTGLGIAHFVRGRWPRHVGRARVPTAYLAPENLAAGELHGAGDRFALAAVLYECLTGGPAFYGPSAAAIAARIRSAHRPRLGRQANLDALPRAWRGLLDGWLQGLWAPDPSYRPSAGTALRSLVDDVVPAAEAGGPAAPWLLPFYRARFGHRPPAPATIDLLTPEPDAPAAYDLSDWSQDVTQAPAVEDADWLRPVGEACLPGLTPSQDILPEVSETTGCWVEAPEGPPALLRSLEDFRQLYERTPARMSADRQRWVTAAEAAARLGAESLLSPAAPLERVRWVEDLAGWSVVALLARVAQQQWTGRLVIIDSGPQRIARREFHLRDGQLMHVGSNHPLMQFPELLFREDQVPDAKVIACVRTALRTGAPLLDVAAAQEGGIPEERLRRYLRLRLSESIRWNVGRAAFDEAARPQAHRAGFETPIYPELVPSVARAFSVEALQRALQPFEGRRLRHSDGFVALSRRLEATGRVAEAVQTLAKQKALNPIGRSGRALRDYLAAVYVLWQIGAIQPDPGGASPRGRAP